MVAGDIHYPGGRKGILLFFKPNLTGDEPTDVIQYQRRNLDFPHESTGDQFYDEAQWESYRRLGQHAVESAFAFLKTEEPYVSSNPARIFAYARHHWLPIPNGYHERVSLITTRVADLEELLHKSNYERLLWEVYKEVQELGQQTNIASQANGTSAPTEIDHAPDGTTVSLPETTIVDAMSLDAATVNNNHAAAAESVHQSQDVSIQPGNNVAKAEPSTSLGLKPQDLVISLHLLRRGIAVMEEVYFSEDLERRYNHPMYLGIMNYFARWAFAPLFRMWWPLLKTMYSHKFTNFLENRFGLAPHGCMDLELVEVKNDAGGRLDGFAMNVWWLMNSEREDKKVSGDQKFESGRLTMKYRNDEPYHIQAAVVLLALDDGIAGWDSEDFLVPPGLWGVGIGEAFLAKLCGKYEYLVVRVPSSDNYHASERATPSKQAVHSSRKSTYEDTVKKSQVDDTQMYRSANFAWAEAIGTELLKINESEWITIPPALRPSPPNQYSWLVYKKPIERCIDN
jgi:hypothetical protein